MSVENQRGLCEEEPTLCEDTVCYEGSENLRRRQGRSY